jgi:acyl dehydratase
VETAAAAGAVTRQFTGRIDPDAIAAFAAATNDANPRYQDGSAVPPLFTGALVLGAQIEANGLGFGPVRITGSTGGVHGEHQVSFVRPCVAGMALRWVGSTHSVRQTTGGVLVTLRIAVTDEAGDTRVDHLWSNFLPGAEVDRDFGPPVPDHAFLEAARPRPVGAARVMIDRDQGFRYAGVSGDHIGHSMDDLTAREEGFPGKIIQGMCSFGLASGAVVDMVADGDPDRLSRLAVRFAAPVFPRRELSVGVYDAGVGAGGGRSFAFEAEQDGRVVLKHGRAELRP